MSSTPLNTWQHVQLDIDLAGDTYDLSWSANGDPLELLAPHIGFRSGTKDFLDRFVVAQWTGVPSRPEGIAYLDNVNIEVLQRAPGDANMDGDVNFADFLTLSENFGEGSRRDPRAWSQGDFEATKKSASPIS